MAVRVQDNFISTGTILLLVRTGLIKLLLYKNMGLNFINFPSYGNYSHSITSSIYTGRNEKALSNYQTQQHKTSFF